MRFEASRRIELADTGVPAAMDWQALVGRIRGGEEQAFEVLFRTFYQELYEFALGYVDTRADAEDAAHDVLMAIWRGRATFEVHTDLRAYLFAAVRRRARQRAARPDIEAERLDRWQQDPTVRLFGPVEGAQEALERAELQATIAQAVAKLPRRQREVFSLRAGNELHYVEIAQVLGTTVKNVEVQLRRAVHALRTALADLK